MVDGLPTTQRLNKHYNKVPTQCSLCNAADENATHLFINCDFTRQLIQNYERRSGKNLLLKEDYDEDIKDLLQYKKSCNKSTIKELAFI